MNGKKEKLYCPKCKKYVTRIIEKYLETIEEEREYNEDGYYELVETNIDDAEFEQLCAKCRTKLEIK